jgi:hypothetical protein
MTVTVEQANFLCDVFRTFPFSADVRTEKKVFFLVVGGRTVLAQPEMEKRRSPLV